MADGRSWFIPEVVQSSLMDCGPAALQAVLHGFGVRMNYDEIRTRCQTDVDGTSIFELARLGRELGLEASQVLVPRDTLLLPEAECLPAIAVVQRGADNLHFIVVWRSVGRWVQVLDPATGRRHLPRAQLLATLSALPIPVARERIERWLQTRFAREPLQRRLLRLGLAAAEARSCVTAACSKRDPGSYAALDAAARMTAKLIEAGAVRRGREAARFLREVAADAEPEARIPLAFWWLRPSPSPGTLVVYGAPIVCFARSKALTPGPRQRASRPLASRARPKPAPGRESPAGLRGPGAVVQARVSGEGVGAWRLLGRLLTLEGAMAPCWTLGAALLTAALSALDVVTLQALLESTRLWALPYQLAAAALVLLALSLAGLGVELAVASGTRRAGRRLELFVRAALSEQLPLLPDAYLRTRPTSDMAQRAHALHLLRDLPAALRRGLSAAAEVVVSSAALIGLFPAVAPLALSAALLVIVLPWVLSRAAFESAVRARSHLVSLDRFYLDALLGAIPIRVHGAEAAVSSEHEALLVEWARSTIALQRATTWLRALGMALASGLSLWIVVAAVSSGASGVALLLVAFWASRVPVAGMACVDSLVGGEALKHTVLRLVAPLAAPARAARPERPARPRHAPPAASSRTAPGVELELDHVTARAGGHVVLSDLVLHVPAGQHVAIVGASGAGKSSLASLLLGWLEPTLGQIRVDRRPLDAATSWALRRDTAWIDPGVHLWNDTLLDNVLYGAPPDATPELPAALETAQLNDVIESQPDGVHVGLGEGGARLSGGQGQRVRIARGWLRAGARLVILDEPFRGLERERRHELLARVRARFAGATLLFITHDIEEAQAFERVLVVSEGRIVEDGAPAALLRRRTGHYRALFDANAGQQAFGAALWKRARLEQGRLTECA